MNLAEAPAPLTSRDRAIYWIVLLICAASRFLAIARSLWDWDEALFSLGMRSYDVASHHPHPPGFPVYIAAEYHELASSWPSILAACVGVVLGTLAGKPLLQRIPEKLYRAIVSLIILALGIWMLIHPGR